MKIAICFFGITRSLKFNIKSINKNVIDPCKNYGNVKLFGHFYEQESIHNPRSNENEALDLDEYKLLHLDFIDLEKPGCFIEDSDFEEVCKYGDEYSDGFQSVKNLFHQLWSLRKVTLRALSWGADVVLFVRPDLLYHDSFDSEISRCLNADQDFILLPNWQHHGGYNDRFSIVKGKEAVRAYGCRYEQLLKYCSEKCASLQSESFLKYSIKKIRVKFISVRASRVRASGCTVKEDFYHFNVVRINKLLKFMLIYKNNFTANIASKFILVLQSIVYGDPYKGLEVTNMRAISSSGPN